MPKWRRRRKDPPRSNGIRIPGQTAKLLHFRIHGIATTRITASRCGNGPASIGTSTRIRAALPDIVQPIVVLVIPGAASYSQEDCSPFPGRPAISGPGCFSKAAVRSNLPLRQCRQRRTERHSRPELPKRSGSGLRQFGSRVARTRAVTHRSA